MSFKPRFFILLLFIALRPSYANDVTQNQDQITSPYKDREAFYKALEGNEKIAAIIEEALFSDEPKFSGISQFFENQNSEFFNFIKDFAIPYDHNYLMGRVPRIQGAYPKFSKHHQYSTRIERDFRENMFDKAVKQVEKEKRFEKIAKDNPDIARLSAEFKQIVDLINQARTPMRRDLELSQKRKDEEIRKNLSAQNLESIQQSHPDAYKLSYNRIRNTAEVMEEPTKFYLEASPEEMEEEIKRRLGELEQKIKKALIEQLPKGSLSLTPGRNNYGHLLPFDPESALERYRFNEMILFDRNSEHGGGHSIIFGKDPNTVMHSDLKYGDFVSAENLDNLTPHFSDTNIAIQLLQTLNRSSKNLATLSGEDFVRTAKSLQKQYHLAGNALYKFRIETEKKYYNQFSDRDYFEGNLYSLLHGAYLDKLKEDSEYWAKKDAQAKGLPDLGDTLSQLADKQKLLIPDKRTLKLQEQEFLDSMRQKNPNSEAFSINEKVDSPEIHEIGQRGSKDKPTGTLWQIEQASDGLVPDFFFMPHLASGLSSHKLWTPAENSKTDLILQSKKPSALQNQHFGDVYEEILKIPITTDHLIKSISLKSTSGSLLKENVDFRVLCDAGNASCFVRFNKRQNPGDSFFYDIEYSLRRESEKLAKSDHLVPEEKLQLLKEELKEAGMSEMLKHVEALPPSKVKFSDLERAAKLGSSYVTSRSQLPQEQGYNQRFTSIKDLKGFVDEKGYFCTQCTGSAVLSHLMAKLVFAESDIKSQTRTVFMYDGSGKIEPPAHAINTLLQDGRISQIADFTPALSVDVPRMYRQIANRNAENREKKKNVQSEKGPNNSERSAASDLNSGIESEQGEHESNGEKAKASRFSPMEFLKSLGVKSRNFLSRVRVKESRPELSGQDRLRITENSHSTPQALAATEVKGKTENERPKLPEPKTNSTAAPAPTKPRIDPNPAALRILERRSEDILASFDAIQKHIEKQQRDFDVFIKRPQKGLGKKANIEGVLKDYIRGSNNDYSAPIRGTLFASAKIRELLRGTATWDEIKSSAKQISNKEPKNIAEVLDIYKAFLQQCQNNLEALQNKSHPNYAKLRKGHFLFEAPILMSRVQALNLELLNISQRLNSDAYTHFANSKGIALPNQKDVLSEMIQLRKSPSLAQDGNHQDFLAAELQKTNPDAIGFIKDNVELFLKDPVTCSTLFSKALMSGL